MPEFDKNKGFKIEPGYAPFKMKGFSGFKSSPAKSHKKGHKDQQGPIPEKNQPLRKSEMKGTWVYEGKGTKDPYVTSERITDLEDRAEFARSDAEEAKGKKKKEHQKTAKHLEREADIIRDRTRNQKKPPLKHKKTKTVDVPHEHKSGPRNMRKAKGFAGNF